MEEEVKTGVNKKFLVWGILAVILGCVIGYLIYRTTPAYALSQLETGFKEQDEAKIREFMDVEGTIGGFIDEYIEVYCERYQEMLEKDEEAKKNPFYDAEKQAGFVKSLMVNSSSAIKESAKQSLLKKEPDGRFKQFKSLELSHIDRDGEIAFAHLILHRDSEEPVPLKLKMVQLDSNLWYVTGVENSRQVWEMALNEMGVVK